MARLVADGRLVGIDLGGDRTTTVLHSGEIIRSELGGHDTPSLVAFKARDRSIGEAAVSLVTSAPKNTIGAVRTLAGTLYSSWSQRALTEHLAFQHIEASGGHPKGGVAVSVERKNGPQTFGGTEILAMYLGKLRECASATPASGDVGRIVGCFSSPVAASPVERRAVLDAARIAGFADAKVFPASDCLCAVYSRKHPVAPGSNPETVIIVDIGQLQTTVVAASFGEAAAAAGEGEGADVVAEATKSPSAGCPYSVLGVRSDEDLGASHFDGKMFHHFRGVVKEKYSHDVVPGSKQGLRLLIACRRLRELLSTTPTAETAVENLVDGVDVPLSLTRAELATLCEEELGKIKTLVRGCLEEAATDTGSLAGAQAFGGGCRMPIVQEAIREEVGIPLGSRLDSSSLAYGAALLAEAGGALHATQEALATTEGMPDDGIFKAIADEHERQKEDAEVRAIALERNELEALLFDMNSAPNKKHGELLDKEALKGVLSGLEDWLYSEEADEADLAELKEKRRQVDNELKDNVAKAYFSAVEADRIKVEAEMEAEAKAFENEKNNPEEDDHDTRKLPKPERMRLVVKNKEEGTELFKGQNYRQAGARYSKALTHAAKMFDLSSDEQKEVHAVQLSLYLNLAQCYLKLQSWDQAVNNCTLALKIDQESSKALYRRAYARFAKKDYDAAKVDLDKAQKSAPGDKAVATLLKKVDVVLKKQQAKEKQMWSKAFS